MSGHMTWFEMEFKNRKLVNGYTYTNTWGWGLGPLRSVPTQLFCLIWVLYWKCPLLKWWPNTLLEFSFLTCPLFLWICLSFGTTNHELLLAKLHAYGFSKSSLQIIFTYLSEWWHHVKINSAFSSLWALLQGFPQGSVLGHSCLISIWMTCFLH